MYSRRKFLNRILQGSGAAVILGNSSFSNAAQFFNKIDSEISPIELASDDSFWGNIQSAFEVDRTIINLNNGGVSPSPKSVHEILKQYLDYSNKAPSYFMWRHLEPNIESVREQLARSFKCDKEEIAITRNASEALENIQLGMNLKESDEVLTTTQDYPRMITTWNQRVRRDKIVLKKVSYPTPLMNKNDFIKAVENGITSKTKVIHLSHVVYLTGQILPVKEISRIAHQKGIEVICDGAHSFNHFPFTLEDLECDYFGTSLHKWTYAPVGTGFLYAKKDKIINIWSLMASDEKQENDIRKFEEIGTHPAANHNAIAEALAFNETIGLERKAERFRYLHSRWIDRLKKYDNVKFMVNIEDINQWCGIINVNVEGTNPEKLCNWLFDKHRIFTVPIIHDEYKGIRVTPNVYTRTSEIDFFAEVIENVAAGSVDEVKGE
jgi:selenocysteine lyase/cysteine desulfurase